jgi:hypothetical protein
MQTCIRILDIVQRSNFEMLKKVDMRQQAVVARTGFDEEREVNKRVLNTLILNTSLNERLNVIELN